jgi:uncharacterized protein YdeI (BOF family)
VKPYLVTIALAILTGCSERNTRHLGAIFDEAKAATVLHARQTNTEANLILHGTMTQKCPVAGCWFMLQDASGIIKVDTKNAGFVVVDVPLQSTVTIAGRVMTNGTERFIDATGLRY